LQFRSERREGYGRKREPTKDPCSNEKGKDGKEGEEGMSPNGVARLLRVLASCRFESVLYLPRLIDGCSY
jgi:hypothetical protein